MMKKRLWNKNTGMVFLIIFLLVFMLLIFGPAEIFFANAAEFEFVYGEFAGYLAVLAVAVALFGTIVLSLLPKKIRNILLSILFGISVAGYFQVMFWNKGLDLLGQSAEGYYVNQNRVLGNLVFWLFILFFVAVLSVWKNAIWKKVVVYISIFMLCIQMAALVSLMLTADEAAYKHQEGQWRLSGDEQFMVSAEKNVIVFIIDYFGNQLLGEMRRDFPDATDFLHDFTEYTNTDSVYFGTYPSLAHMLTGCKLDAAKGVNEWLKQSWQDEKTVQFYGDLHNAGYVVNLYTDNMSILCGTNDTDILKNKISNLQYIVDDVDVFYKRLFKTMIKMSGYRMFPEIIKPYFYTNNSEYTSIVEAVEHPLLHTNYDFYEALVDTHLVLDRESDYLIIQHLEGTHDYFTDADGHYSEENTSRAVTAKGCMTIMEEYINQLKENGVYDNATIIITADHSTEHEVQPVFFVKEAGEVHDKLMVNNAPISHAEFLPTLAEYAGLDYRQYGSGKSIHDYKKDEEREREFWLGRHDENYPDVPKYTGEKGGVYNVYLGYNYTGGTVSMPEINWDEPDHIVQMADSYF